jgi:hypothetical protein
MAAMEGVPTLYVDMHGIPILSGDVLSYLGPKPCVFVVKINEHGLDIPILPSELALCEIIKRASE